MILEKFRFNKFFLCIKKLVILELFYIIFNELFVLICINNMLCCWYFFFYFFGFVCVKNG